MCRVCDDFSATIKITLPGEYHRLKEEILLALGSGKIVLLQGTCKLEDIKKEAPWPADIIQHDFKCASCGRKFRLFVDTYHGRGSWRMLE